VPGSSCRGIKLPAATATRRRALEPHDVIRLAETIGSRYEAMVWVGAVLGLRWAEVADLTVGSLDLLRNALNLTEQLGRDRQLGDPKSDAGKRQLSIPEELSTVLAAHVAARNLTGADPGQLVFTTPQGRPLDYSHWRIRTWLPAVAEARLAGAGFHDLRRANATTLVAEGVTSRRLRRAWDTPTPVRRCPSTPGPSRRPTGPRRTHSAGPSSRLQARHRARNAHGKPGRDGTPSRRWGLTCGFMSREGGI
jgi:integrase